ncbi:DUF962 domain-containing protein [Thermaerobacillus caldiproteolyticus]|uniref:DUF962 domain-containing protein n=1 Tax=Thermaerobacillus caldiproteolyticus TaxID=247480 RepID=A0A7V9Z9R5_9BACL|nr:DUF962 domain-containing protein [Anoxybacillus caldiproteolyticus]MBA2876664.1 hypothetical protein [Anoxybacillus caldiproteolyticus]
MEFKDYEEFWPFYLLQHSKRATRVWHFIGTSFVFVFVLLTIVTLHVWWLLAAPFAAYSFAWFSHFFIERNKPATFGHPLWSLRADFRMYRLMLFGQLQKELEMVRGQYYGNSSVEH